jgi:hypothetical protein
MRMWGWYFGLQRQSFTKRLELFSFCHQCPHELSCDQQTNKRQAIILIVQASTIIGKPMMTSKCHTTPRNLSAAPPLLRSRALTPNTAPKPRTLRNDDDTNSSAKISPDNNACTPLSLDGEIRRENKRIPRSERIENKRIPRSERIAANKPTPAPSSLIREPKVADDMTEQ